MRLKNDAFNVSMAFLREALQKKLPISVKCFTKEAINCFFRRAPCI